jgi:cation transport regulator
MPYGSTADLPVSVKKALPQHAQEIYKEAFNNAWDQYASPESRRGKASREQVAHKVAWSAVKEKYEKGNGHWVRKSDPKKT